MSKDRVKVLFLAADPLSAATSGPARLLLDEEVRQIRQKVRAAPRDTLDFDLRLAVRADDLIEALAETHPQVVHFSGHGTNDGLMLASADGTDAQRVDATALRRLFEVFRGDIRVVVLNACWSLPQAEAVADVVGCAIGTRGQITDKGAITFGASFYRAIALGRSVKEAYDQARAALFLQHAEDDESPVLVTRPDVDPAQLVLVHSVGANPVTHGMPETGAPNVLQPKGRKARMEIPVSTPSPGGRPLASGSVSSPRRAADESLDTIDTLQKDAEGETTTTQAGLQVETRDVEAAASSASAGRRRRDEAVPMHTDDPATVDQLQRRPFAEVLGARIEEVRAAQSSGLSEGGAFMVHVHGPWGAGKTSVLNFLRSYLQDGDRPAERRWVVVDFNAWRQQRIRPPWWPLLREVYAQAARQLGFRRSLWLRAQWLWWRFRADWVPAAAAILLILITVALTVGALNTLLSAPGAPSSPPSGEGDSTAKSVELALKILTALFAAGGAVLAASRSLVFGSSSAAQAYASLRNDPLSPIVRLFQHVVRAVGRPVVVFVDDLDRCDGMYVVELLEGMQTLFRTAPVAYVVAADRKWICSSFEKGYGDFCGAIGEPGRPLGYLFLDKIFQVSASVPRPSPEARKAYWTHLLRTTTSGGSDPGAMDAAVKQAEQRAKDKLGGAHTQEEIEAKIAEVAAEPDSDTLTPAMRAVGAKRITTPEAREETEHRLQRFAGLLDSNPRSMKRLVNAFGLHQATHFLEGRSVAPDALVRWTIIELRWPLLADYLAARPSVATDLIEGRAPEDDRLDEDLKSLFGDPSVLTVVRGGEEEEGVILDMSTIRDIVGTSTMPLTA
jgi:hypothetical protein